MKRLKNALAWNGTTVTMSMFIISPDREPTPLALGSLTPRTVKTYELADEDNVVGSHHLFEYDLIWDELPEPIEGIVTTAMKDAISKGAILVWFGFEGSFDFQYILHPEIARQVYAVATPESVWLAIPSVSTFAEADQVPNSLSRGREGSPPVDHDHPTLCGPAGRLWQAG